MSKILKLIFITIHLFSIYHLFRDLLTNFGIHNYVLDFNHRHHLWCDKLYSWVCSWITVPPEVFNIVASLVVLKRDRIGILGFILLLQPLVWFLILLIP